WRSEDAARGRSRTRDFNQAFELNHSGIYAQMSVPSAIRQSALRQNMRFWHFTTFILGIVALWLLAPNGYINSWLSTQSAYEKELGDRIRSELEKPHATNSEQDTANAKRMLERLTSENTHAMAQRERYRLFGSIAVSVLMAGLAIWIIQRPRLRRDGFQWAYGTLGVILGYWLK